VRNMLEGEFLTNVGLLVLCYSYVLFVIFVSGKVESFFDASSGFSRKFLHMMIGNLVFIIPFFSLNSFPLNFPFFVAAPFVVVTFLATPYSYKAIHRRMGRLSTLTEKGHSLGLLFYALSYTILAFFFSPRAYLIGVGVLPMAYGDASASFIGEKYGKTKYRIFDTKSIEGSMAMFLVSLASLAFGLYFFSLIYHFSFFDLIPGILGATLIATLAEGLSPRGFDNLTVPLLSVLSFLVLGGGL
jgi:phytol kinase